MQKNNTPAAVTEWVLAKVREEYADDIALVVSHTTLNIDRDTPAISYFIPITDRGRAFARTMIVDGVGCDIWGIEWDRMEKFASLEEYNVTCLADGEILWARTDADAERFYALQETQRKHLADPAYTRRLALESYAQADRICSKLFSHVLAGEISHAKMCAGYVLDYLARAIAFANGRYFRHSHMEQTEELNGMESVPAGFTGLYDRILREKEPEMQKKMCCEALMLTREFLEREGQTAEESAPEPKDFQMLADWYAELSYTWLRIRHYAAEGNVHTAYMWGSLLQLELNTVCEEFALSPMGLMEAFDPDDLPAFAAHADRLEETMRRIITEGGGVIREYAGVQEII